MSENSITLAANLDLLAAAPLKTEIAARAGNAVALDASGVERLGAQCLQVLLAAKAKWNADGLALDIVEPSAQFRDHLKLMGAPEILKEIPMEEVCS